MKKRKIKQIVWVLAVVGSLSIVGCNNDSSSLTVSIGDFSSRKTLNYGLTRSSVSIVRN